MREDAYQKLLDDVWDLARRLHELADAASFFSEGEKSRIRMCARKVVEVAVQNQSRNAKG